MNLDERRGPRRYRRRRREGDVLKGTVFLRKHRLDEIGRDLDGSRDEERDTDREGDDGWRGEIGRVERLEERYGRKGEGEGEEPGEDEDLRGKHAGEANMVRGQEASWIVKQIHEGGVGESATGDASEGRMSTEA